MTPKYCPSCTCEFERLFEAFIDDIAEAAGESFESYEDIVLSDDELKETLAEAVQAVRDYALPTGDRVSEDAIHSEIDSILDELRSRGII